MSSRRGVFTLRRAIEQNNCKEVRRVLGINPSLMNENIFKSHGVDYTPLWLAMIHGHTNVVKLLIKEFGADPDEKYNGVTFLHSTAISDSSECFFNVVKVLIKLGADVNAKSPFFDNKNPLQIALSSKNLKFVKLLLKNGADLSKADFHGDSPLAYAFRSGKSSTAKKILLLLLKYGVDTTFISKDGENVLHLFLTFAEQDYENPVEIAEILLDQGLPLNDVNSWGCTPLNYSISDCDKELIKFFINKGAEINTKCFGTEKRYGSFPLYAAVKRGDKEIVDLLLSNGADINFVDDHGCTALHEACFSLHGILIDFLIWKGANVNVKNNDGETPFYIMLSTLDAATYYNDDDYDTLVLYIIKEFARLHYKDISIAPSDMNLIRINSKLAIHFESCIDELYDMSCDEFYPPYSYYSVLEMSGNIKKLANLVKNEEFVSEFYTNLSEYDYYDYNLECNIEEALKVKNEMMVVDAKLKHIFSDVLPNLVIQKLAEFLTAKDIL